MESTGLAAQKPPKAASPSVSIPVTVVVAVAVVQVVTLMALAAVVAVHLTTTPPTLTSVATTFGRGLGPINMYNRERRRYEARADAEVPSPTTINATAARVAVFKHVQTPPPPEWVDARVTEIMQEISKPEAVWLTPNQANVIAGKGSDWFSTAIPFKTSWSEYLNMGKFLENLRTRCQSAFDLTWSDPTAAIYSAIRLQVEPQYLNSVALTAVVRRWNDLFIGTGFEIADCYGTSYMSSNNSPLTASVVFNIDASIVTVVVRLNARICRQDLSTCECPFMDL